MPPPIRPLNTIWLPSGHHEGDYDMVGIYEAPDDAVAARFILQLGAMGNLRTRTMKAFPEAAYREIINSLG